MIDFGRGSTVDIKAFVESLKHIGVAAYIGNQTKLYLRIVG